MAMYYSIINGEEKMAYRKCDFVKMGTRIIPKKTSDKLKTKRILEERKRRAQEWNKWLRG